MQENLNTAPFADNQKIVRTGPSKNGLFKGNVYTAGVCEYCPKCETWRVPIKEFPAPKRNQERCNCGNYKYNVSYYSGFAKYFAPIQTQYSDITKEIADSVKETVEAPDKILIPQTVNN